MYTAKEANDLCQVIFDIQVNNRGMMRLSLSNGESVTVGYIGYSFSYSAAGYDCTVTCRREGTSAVPIIYDINDITEVNAPE